MPGRVPKERRRGVFGRDPRGYDRARLAYPDRLYEILQRRCGLAPGRSVLEIGPGTGIATRALLREGAGPMTLVEADPRLVRYLRTSLERSAASVTVLAASFESVRLPSAAYDLVVAASSFHWLPPRRALRKVARVLRPGGWWAAWNNHHGDPYHEGEFQAALQPLYRTLRGARPWTYGRSARGRDQDRRERERRLAAVASIGAFDRIRCTNLRWSAELPARRVVALWATFSDVATLPPARRRWLLSEIGRLARDRFGGAVTLQMVTPLYTARRK